MTATGTFTARDGAFCKVEISGASISEARTLLLAGEQPVTIDYRQGDTKFEGFRSVNCTVRILSDGDASWLYSDSPTGSALTVSRLSGSSWTVLFKGCLLPFSFESPSSGRNDEVELQAVDAVTALKCETYQGGHALVARRMLDYVADVLLKAGVHRMIILENYGRTSDTSSTALSRNIERLSVPEQAWLPQGLRTSDKDKGTSLPEILSAIARFLGFTAMLWGDCLYMFDSYARVTMSRTHYTEYGITESGGQRNITKTEVRSGTLFGTKTVTAADIRRSGSRHSVEQAFGRLVLTPGNTDTMVIIPQIFTGGEMAGEAVEDVIENEEDPEEAACMVIRRVLTGVPLETHRYFTADGSEMSLELFIINAESMMKGGGSLWYGAVPLRIRQYNDLEEYNGVTEKDLLWIHVPSGAQAAAHTVLQILPACRGWMDTRRWRMRCGMYVRTGGGVDRPWLPPSYGESGDAGRAYLQSITLKSGDNMYSIDEEPGHGILPTGVWNASRVHNVLVVGRKDSADGEKTLPVSLVAFRRLESGWIDEGMEGSFNMGWDVAAGAGQSDYWLSDFEVEVAGDEMRDEDFEHVLQQGNPEDLSVSAPLCRSYASLKRVVYGTMRGTYCAGADTSETAPPLCGVLESQLLARYGSRHDRWQISVGDDVEPWTLVSFMSDTATVDAMEWDVEDCTRQIILN